VSPLLDPLSRLVALFVQFATGILLLFIPAIEPLTTLLSAILTPIFEIMLQIATAALPPLTEAFGRLSEKLVPLIEQFGTALLEAVQELLLPENLAMVGVVVNAIVAAIDLWIRVFFILIEVMKRAWVWIKENLVPVIRDELWPLVRDQLIPTLRDLWTELGTLKDAVADFWAELQELVAVMTDELDPQLSATDVLLAAVYAAIFLVRYWVILLTGTIRIITGIIEPWVDAWEDATDAIRRTREAIQVIRSSGVDLLDTIKGIIDRGLRVANIFYDLRDAAYSVARAINSIPSLPSGIGAGLLPFFANGGIVTRATAAVIGEAGPEVVLPLNRPRRALELAMESGLFSVLASGTAAARSSAGSTTSSDAGAGVVVQPGAVVIQFNGAVTDEQQARRIGNAAGEGLLNTLATRNVRLAIRGI
jgi:hypothetical protein